MANALPGGTATGSPGSVPEGSIRRPGQRADTQAGSKGGEFERMLESPAGNDAQRATRPEPADAAATEPTYAGHDGTGSFGDIVDQADASATRAAPAREADTRSEDDVIAWPPAGLAGLILSTAMPAAGSPPAAAVASAASDVGTPPPPLPAPALAPALAMANTTGVATGSDHAVGTDAPQATGLPLDLDALLQASATDVGESSDGPPGTIPTLHGIGALQALRAGTEALALRGTEPTPTPVFGQDTFDEAVSTRVGWLAEQKIGHAHIRISPDDLGAIDVRLRLDGDKVHASFSSPHVEVRHALENSLPRLREMLGEQGFQLGNADVGQQAQGDSRPSQGHGGFASVIDDDTVLGEATLSSGQIRQRGILDAYA